MYATIVVGLDGSDASARAVPHAAQLAAQGSEVVAVHVRELFAARGSPQPVELDENAAEHRVREQVDKLQQAGAKTELIVASAMVGGAAHVIADVARDRRADLIIVGTRGHTRIAGLLIGSVTQRLLQIASCPVLAVPPERADRPKTAP